MANLLKGIAVANQISDDLINRANALKEKGITPCLAIIRVGEREDDLSYERGALKRCEKIGIEVKQYVFPNSVTTDELIQQINVLNVEKSVHGVLIFRPLPKHIDDQAICNALSPLKDVDGITNGGMASVFANNNQGFAPCTAKACVEILKHYNIPIVGKNVVVLGRSLVIGKPVSMLLLNENATVTICHSKSENLMQITKKADVLVVALGKAQMVTKDYVSSGQTIIDVGIHVNPDGTMCGDCNFAEIEPIVENITPVPGGVGSVTTSILASHVIISAERK